VPGFTRKDSTHKLTTMLARTFAAVVVHDLFVAAMVKNHSLARHVADAWFGQIRRQLEYKTTCNGGRRLTRPVVPELLTW
jgi:putative transposase